jgi:hypothetical protein
MADISMEELKRHLRELNVPVEDPAALRAIYEELQSQLSPPTESTPEFLPSPLLSPPKPSRASARHISVSPLRDESLLNDPWPTSSPPPVPTIPSQRHTARISTSLPDSPVRTVPLAPATLDPIHVPAASASSPAVNEAHFAPFSPAYEPSDEDTDYLEAVTTARHGLKDKQQPQRQTPGARRNLLAAFAPSSAGPKRPPSSLSPGAATAPRRRPSSAASARRARPQTGLTGASGPTPPVSQNPSRLAAGSPAAGRVRPSPRPLSASASLRFSGASQLQASLRYPRPVQPPAVSSSRPASAGPKPAPVSGGPRPASGRPVTARAPKRDPVSLYAQYASGWKENQRRGKSIRRAPAKRYFEAPVANSTLGTDTLAAAPSLDNPAVDKILAAERRLLSTSPVPGPRGSGPGQ